MRKLRCRQVHPLPKVTQLLAELYLEHLSPEKLGGRTQGRGLGSPFLNC